MFKGYIIHGFLNVNLIRATKEKGDKTLDINVQTSYNSRLFENDFSGKKRMKNK